MGEGRRGKGAMEKGGRGTQGETHPGRQRDGEQSNRHELRRTQSYTSGRNRDRLRNETQREVGGGKQSIPEMQRGTETLGVRDRETSHRGR